MKYAQNEDKRHLFINVTTVLPPSGGVGLQTETFSGSAEVSLRPSRVPKRSKWQDRRIIPDNRILAPHSHKRGYEQYVANTCQCESRRHKMQ